MTDSLPIIEAPLPTINLDTSRGGVEHMTFFLDGKPALVIRQDGFEIAGEFIPNERGQAAIDGMFKFLQGVTASQEEIIEARTAGAYDERDSILGFGNEYVMLKERKGEKVAAQHVAEFLANIEKNAHVAGLRSKKKV